MRVIPYLIAGCFVLSFLTQCKSKEASLSDTNLDTNFLHHIGYQPSPEVRTFSLRSDLKTYIGDWDYSFPFFSSRLSIMPGGTFEYFDQGCMGKSYSKGRWTDNGTYITLTSEKREKFPKRFDYEIVQLPPKKKSKPLKKKKTESGNYRYVIDFTAEVLNMDYRIKLPDTTYIYFDKRRMQIIGDSLYTIDDNFHPAGDKFAFRY